MPTTVDAHERVKDLEWSPSYVERRERYPTKYRIPPRTKDPFRTLIREYVSMEEEKDDRQYGALEDVLARVNAPQMAERRWLDLLKIVLPTVNFAEYAASKACAQLIDTVANQELRQGYQAQMIDEVRHTHQQMYLNRYFAKHAPDPEGFTLGLKAKGGNIFGRTGRTAFETFFMGDVIEGVMNLQVVTETAYTNALFVSITEMAAAQGDMVTPGVFLSIQSDEARHMANGYSTLAAVLSEPDNHQYLQADFDRGFWRQHNFLDVFLGAARDYGQVNRGASYLERWREWVAEDWVGSFVAKLEPFGLQAPRDLALAEQRVPWMGHSVFMIATAAWPLMFWRQSPLSDADMEWFEEKYPGWYDHYGWFWEGMREMQEPGSGNPFNLLTELPPICRVCQMVCVLPRLDINDIRIREHEGRRHAFCSAPCERIFDEDPGRYLGFKTFWELWDGCGLDEFIVKQGLLRADGKTLIGQPHNSDDPKLMWTIDDIRALEYEIKDPLQNPDSTFIV
jgi:Methane/Phenol/Toluene Hydroxylase